MAECGVVIADLQADGELRAPSIYLDLREEDMSLKDGIRIEDMGVKTIANDLDNARGSDQVRFQN